VSALAGGGHDADLPGSLACAAASAWPRHSGAVASLSVSADASRSDGPLGREWGAKPGLACNTGGCVDGGGGASISLTRRSARDVSNGTGGRALPRLRTFAWQPAQSLASTFA
jgi:hypothetical protein